MPSSKKLASDDEQCALKVVDAPTQSACAYARYRDLPTAFQKAVDAHGCVHVHFHEHPAHVQRLVIDENIAEGCISLNDVQRLNNRVCVHDAPAMTLYRGRHEALDAREAAIGMGIDKEVRDPPCGRTRRHREPMHRVPILHIPRP